jgi:LDH2 family malate/lactate/ureidoglycolate dehydrogenase
VPLAKGFEEIVYPGELETRNDARNLQRGVTLPADTIVDLAKLARELGLQSQLPF